MKSLIKKIFYNPHICIITLIGVILFLGFSGGVWTYLDLEGSPIFPSQGKYLAYLNFLSFHNSSAFGVDSLQSVGPKVLHIFGIAYLGQFLFYWLFYSSTYLSSFFLLRYFTNKYSAFFGALFFTINPVSIFFMQENAFIFGYTGLSFIVLGLFMYYTHKQSLIGMLLLMLGFNFSLTYPRIAIIHMMILIIISIFYWRKIIITHAFQKKTLWLIFFVFLSLLPTFYGYLSIYIHGETVYFKGMTNYLEDSIGSVGKSLYFGIKNEGFLANLYPREIFSNFARGFWDQPFINIFEKFFFIILIFLIIKESIINKAKNDLFYLSLGFILFAIFLRKSALFVDENTFILLTYKIFPFLANTIDWHLIILIPFLAILIGLTLKTIKSFRSHFFIGILLITYSIFSIIPFIDNNNVKMQKIDRNNIPNEYKNYFFSDSIKQQSTVFLPTQSLGQTLYFPWAPSPVNLFNNTTFRVAFSNNNRVNGPIQSQLYSQLISNISNTFINYQIFNLKNIILFKDVRNTAGEKFDWFEDKDYQAEVKTLSNKLSNLEYLKIQKTTQYFDHYVPSNSHKYDFFLYNPKSIEYANIESLTKSNIIKLEKAPLLINENSFQLPKSQISNFLGSRVELFYKKSSIDPTKVYLKINRTDPDLPFLLHLNQAFGLPWKIRWVDKAYFDSKPCKTNIQTYSITNNSSCEFNSNLLELNNVSLLGKKTVVTSQHFEGNFIGNSWIIRPEDIPKSIRGNKDIYAVIIYEKQIYYTWTLLISGIVFLLVLIGIIIQRFYTHQRAKLI